MAATKLAGDCGLLFVLGRGDLGGIDSETFDFSQLEEYINDDSESNIYFHDALVSSSDLKLAESAEKSLYVRINSQSLPKDSIHAAAEGPEGHGHSIAAACVAQTAIDSVHSPTTVPQQKGYNRHTRNNSTDVSSTFTKPHHLPDSPPDSGSEPPFSPPNEDPKLRCPSIDILHRHHHLHHLSTEMSVHPSATLSNGMKHPYLGYCHSLPLKHIPEASISSSTSPTSSSSSPHHILPGSPLPIHSAHSTSMPVIAPGSTQSLAGQLLTQIPQSMMSPFVGNSLHQQLVAPNGAHLGHIYAGNEELLYENLSSPVTSTTSTSKKRKLPESPKTPRSHAYGAVQIKTEPSAPSPDPSTSVLPSSDDDYNFELSAADANALFVDSSYQCIRFQAFQQNTWAQLLDKDMKEISSPNFRVDADKGFNYSNADESFVCQKKNHFQVTVHVQPLAEAHFAQTPDGPKAIEKFALHFHGVKMESPTQMIKVEQSQSDRSKRPFHPVPLEMVTDQVTKTTVGRLHFSETTSNNMRKKGKPNPDQRFFFLVVSLCAHVAGDTTPVTVCAHASEKIIVRASNPGQFENDMELSWQKGNTLDSIFHNGRVGINTDRPEESLVVHGNIKVTGHILQPSDLRAKFDVRELDTKEQLKNVSKLRIVRYHYLPEFADHVELNHISDTGVIAQEVQRVIPEAVIPAGDVLLKDGRLIEKLLVVNKERIFMENVGAVKELCKVTDNLENRIDELERINRKLNCIKRTDSVKSTSTDSRMSNPTSSGKRNCHRKCGKLRPGNHALCSSHFVQTTIIILVIIMACCLMALATLYIMEWQSRHHNPYFRNHLAIQVKSSSHNSTTALQDRYALLSSLFPTASSYKYTSLNPDKTSTTNQFVPKSDSKIPSRTPSGVTTPDDLLYGHHSGDVDCLSSDCPVYCCESYAGDEDYVPFPLHEDERENEPHIEKKSGNSAALRELKKHNHSVISPNKSTPQTSKEELESLFDSHKMQKRMIDAAEDNAENINIFRSEYNSEPILRLVELNATLLPELCTEERVDGAAAAYISCSIYISRHFPHPNVTLHFMAEDQDTIIDYCGGKQYSSCNRLHREDKTHLSNKVTKGAFIPQNHSWQLPIGSFFRSRYRFRMIPRRFTTNQQICSLNANHRPFTEYVLTFQRRCDK
ncbi:myelin regulatory factor-like [Uloborus diversus]|uniref:myelin regulatory factor-like n=1 Tax=Uloborus diversus TaxID=327109 RepID=UPI0024097DDF|nr:myelin regulatory factor-like [Uloborus diversus]